MTTHLCNLRSMTKPFLWIAIIVASTILFSFALACATPLAGLAAFTAGTMGRRSAYLTTLAAWLANQAVGYGCLHYPRNFESFSWGAAIGGSALLAILAATTAARRFQRAGVVFVGGAAFLAAFIAYEGALYAAGLLLGSGNEAFSISIVLYVFKVNALAVIGFLVIRQLSVLIGLVAQTPSRTVATV